jgi:alcohol dehydrogenase class IV
MLSNLLHQCVISIRRQANKLIIIPFPTVVDGENSLLKIAEILTQFKGRKPLIVSDEILVKLGLVQKLTDILDNNNIDYALFSQVTPDPTITLISEGVSYYTSHQCDSFIALGGGSVMDCTKAIAAAKAKNTQIKNLTGLFRVRKKLPPLIAIPTTAGTGSEATVVAVVTDPVIKQKLTIVDPCLVPATAIIDPLLMQGLPAKITAETGMDALTHAIESYISLHATEQTKAYSIDAVTRIFKNLSKAYNKGNDLTARQEMSMASLHAGIAFTRTSIGYVHAIAHQLGGYYHIPHGLANAVLLPHILAFSFENCIHQFSKLAKTIAITEVGDSDIVAAKKFINAVTMLNESLNIQINFPELNKSDIPLLAKRAIKEAFCDYPVPKIMSTGQCEEILAKLLVK